MRWLQHLLTIGLVILLTSNVPGATLLCDMQKTDCTSAPEEMDSCCAPSTCACRLSVPGTQQSRPSSAIVVNSVNPAPSKSLWTAGFAISADLSKSPTTEITPAAETTPSFRLPLYALNHAFLI